MTNPEQRAYVARVTRRGTSTLHPRVYFNLVRDEEVIRDGEGIEVADVKQTVLEVLGALKELQQGESPAQACWNGWMVCVTDEDGSVAAIIPLSTTSH